MQEVKPIMRFVDWGLTEYNDAWERQEAVFKEKIDKKLRGEVPENDFVMCEHHPVYTLGRHGKAENLLVSAERLQTIVASLYRIDRGGDITFHGPGQVVGYPIIDLEQWHLGLKQYIWTIEEIIIRTVADYGIHGERSEGATGVWVKKEGIGSRNTVLEKICAIGVRASHYVTMHGFALNVNTDLRYFEYINPCGFTDRGVTSISRLIGQPVDIEDVKKKIICNATELFGISIADVLKN